MPAKRPAASAIPAETSETLGRIAARRPRVQCLTNTVAQTLTANVLLAIGAEVSMAQHPAEVVAMSAGADALLINLGTMDVMREAAVEALLASGFSPRGPVVIDPVFADRSPLRLELARRLLRFPGAILKGNAREMAALAGVAGRDAIRVTTGAIDEISGPSGSLSVAHGHPLMARVTATGCASGALIAAFAAVTDDRAAACAQALTCFGLAGEEAARRCAGPGLFAQHLLDALAEFSDHAARRRT